MSSLLDIRSNRLMNYHNFIFATDPNSFWKILKADRRGLPDCYSQPKCSLCEHCVQRPHKTMCVLSTDSRDNPKHFDGKSFRK